MTNPPSGWCLEAPGALTERYWDGEKWTEHYRQPSQTLIPAEAPQVRQVQLPGLNHLGYPKWVKVTINAVIAIIVVVSLVLFYLIATSGQTGW